MVVVLRSKNFLSKPTIVVSGGDGAVGIGVDARAAERVVCDVVDFGR